MQRHPTTDHWSFPPADRPALAAPLRRTNLRELEARPGRFEHHLMVVARIGRAQLEAVTASEPLYFAHRNVSDEYAMPMATGDPMADAMRFRSFISSFDEHRDLARINHGVHQMVLHPYGFLHWPGRLRPPYRPMGFAPGMRRTGYSVVFCACEPTPPAADRPLWVSAGCEDGPKAYTDVEVPFLLADLDAEAPRTVAVVGETTLELLVRPGRVAPERGGYVLVLDAADGADAFAGDLVFVPPGAALEASGIERAVVMASAETEPAPPPACWHETPPPPFAVHEDAPPGALPVRVGDLIVEDAGADTVRVRVGEVEGEVPRYWLARMLFRIALHEYALGYLETYGGFFYDDTGGRHRLGLRAGGEVALSGHDLADAVERLYRAVAPAGYVERLL